MWTCAPSRILVPVDFGDASGRAIEVAAALARRTGGSLRLLHAEAVEVPAYFTAQQMKALEREQAVARSSADAFLSDFAAGHGATDFATEIIDGLPTPTIVNAAGDADLVVMGTHGRSGPARWWLGSVAERVIHESPTPVLVVRAASGALPEDVFRRPMLLAGDPGSGAPVARVAAELAAAVGGEVVPDAATCAADLAAERGASLIVLSSATRHGRLLSHPAEQWIRSCTLPMLFVPTRARS